MSGGDKSAATRSRLLDAAIRIAATQGLDKVTWRSVAAEAGLSHSLVQFYFGSGEEMLTQALERAARLDVVESELASADIDSFLSTFVSTISDDGNRGLLQYDYLLRAVRGTVPLSRVTKLYDLYLREISETLQNVGIEDEDGTIAAMLFATVDGLILQNVVYGSPERTERVLEQVRIVMRLLSRQGAEPATVTG